MFHQWWSPFDLKYEKENGNKIEIAIVQWKKFDCWKEYNVYTCITDSQPRYILLAWELSCSSPNIVPWIFCNSTKDSCFEWKIPRLCKVKRPSNRTSNRNRIFSCNTKNKCLNIPMLFYPIIRTLIKSIWFFKHILKIFLHFLSQFRNKWYNE